MTDFANSAATEKERETISLESQIRMSEQDFQKFIAAPKSSPPFNANLQNALAAAQKVRRS